jgi:hypothetical protein
METKAPKSCDDQYYWLDRIIEDSSDEDDDEDCNNDEDVLVEGRRNQPPLSPPLVTPQKIIPEQHALPPATPPRRATRARSSVARNAPLPKPQLWLPSNSDCHSKANDNAAKFAAASQSAATSSLSFPQALRVNEGIRGTTSVPGSALANKLNTPRAASHEKSKGATQKSSTAVKRADANAVSTLVTTTPTPRTGYYGTAGDIMQRNRDRQSDMSRDQPLPNATRSKSVASKGLTAVAPIVGLMTPRENDLGGGMNGRTVYYILK